MANNYVFKNYISSTLELSRLTKTIMTKNYIVRTKIILYVEVNIYFLLKNYRKSIKF